MNDNIFDNLEPVHMPSLDLTRGFELAKSVQAHMDESQRHMEQISRSAYEERRRTQEAIERTAENTAQTNIQLQKIIENQNAYIDLLRGQLETSQKQLDILKNLFASTEDGVAVEKEIMKITSFIRIVDGKIASVDEYWGDDGTAPQWRQDKHIGTKIKE